MTFYRLQLISVIGASNCLSASHNCSSISRYGSSQSDSDEVEVKTSQPAIKCSKLTMETLKQGVKYVQS